MTTLPPIRLPSRLARLAMMRPAVSARVAFWNWVPLSLRFRNMRRRAHITAPSAVPMALARGQEQHKRERLEREQVIRFESRVERFLQSFVTREILRVGAASVVVTKPLFLTVAQPLLHRGWRTREREILRDRILIERHEAHRWLVLSRAAVRESAGQGVGEVSRMLEPHREVPAAKTSIVRKVHWRVFERVGLGAQSGASVGTHAERPRALSAPSPIGLQFWPRLLNMTASIRCLAHEKFTPAAVRTEWRLRNKREPDRSGVRGASHRTESEPQRSSTLPGNEAKTISAPEAPAWKLDGPAVDRLAEDILSRIERRARIEREKRGR